MTPKLTFKANLPPVLLKHPLGGAVRKIPHKYCAKKHNKKLTFMRNLCPKTSCQKFNKTGHEIINWVGVGGWKKT